MRAAWLLGVSLAASGPAWAGGLVTGGSPRAIGRAGASVVGDDGAGALIANPAAIARRDASRGQLGVVVIDDALSWQSRSEGAPRARDQAGPSVAPVGAAFTAVAGWVIGIGAMTSAVSERALRPPRDVPDPEDLGAAFDYRYAGIAGSARRDTITLAVARRLGDAVAVGVAVGASRVRVREQRRLWAGFSGRDPIGAPGQDVEVALAGDDRFVPGAAAGIVVAPEATALELGASVSWRADAHLAGDAAAAGTAGGPTVTATSTRATLVVAAPVTLRGGARYVGDAFAVELGGELAIAPARAADARWQVTGMTVADPTGVTATVERVPSRLSQRTHGAVRAAVDRAIVPGFLWATAGYAYAVASVAGTRQSPSFGELGGHTVALGLEAATGGVTVTLGWSRTWSRSRTAPSALALDNPFAAGDAAVPAGAYDESVDQLGVLLDIEQ